MVVAGKVGGKASSLEASGRQGDGALTRAMVGAAGNPCKDQLNASALGKETMNKINDLTVGEAEAGRKR